jgi:2-phosphoglycerate kinase
MQAAMEYSRVIFMGGAPMIGKTTIAREIACRLQYDRISTDDIGAAIASVTKPASHPAFHYMGDRDFREYYITSHPNDLIRDLNLQHEALWPALLSLFRNHSTWSSAAIIEGWALRPEYVARLSGDISGLFLLADAALIEARIRSNGFSRGASNEEMMIQRYLERSLWYDARIRKLVADLGLKSVLISANKTPNEIADACLQELKRPS